MDQTPIQSEGVQANIEDMDRDDLITNMEGLARENSDLKEALSESNVMAMAKRLQELEGQISETEEGDELATEKIEVLENEVSALKDHVIRLEGQTDKGLQQRVSELENELAICEKRLTRAKSTGKPRGMS